MFRNIRDELKDRMYELSNEEIKEILNCFQGRSSLGEKELENNKEELKNRNSNA